MLDQNDEWGHHITTKKAFHLEMDLAVAHLEAVRSHAPEGGGSMAYTLQD